jgi:single-strand DNA-binding protein
MNFNRVFLAGRCTRDPELRYTPRGTPVADVALAINRTWMEEGQKREEVTFVDVTLWGRLAQVVVQYLSKGREALVEGRLQLDTWDDKQTGQKRSRLRVVGESLQFLGQRPERRDTDLDIEPEDIPF